MSERVKGEHQELHQAIGRVIRIRTHTTGSPERPVEQCQITIPAAIVRLMLARTALWQWDVNDDGVLLRPVDPESQIPTWAKNGNGS